MGEQDVEMGFPAFSTILLFGPCGVSSRPGRMLHTPTWRAAVKDARVARP
jgi:hypothetical protein